MRDGVVLLAHLLAVAVERVAFGRPVTAVMVPAVGRLLVRPLEVVVPAGIPAVAAPAVAAHDLPLRELLVVLHDVRLDAADARVRVRADAGCLEPERRMPAGVLRLAAADLEVAVLLHEEGLLPLAERPEAGRVARDVVGERAGLEVRGREVVPLPNEVELHRLARHLHAFEAVREGREVVSPEALAAHPLRPVDLLPVELVVPDERPLLSGRQQGGRLAGDGLRLHLHGGARLDVRLDEFGPGAERRERGKANELYLHDAEQFSIFWPCQRIRGGSQLVATGPPVGQHGARGDTKARRISRIGLHASL